MQKRSVRFSTYIVKLQPVIMHCKDNNRSRIMYNKNPLHIAIKISC